MKAKPKYDYSRMLVTKAPVKRVAIEDKKQKALKHGKVSAECTNGQHASCAVRTCKCKAVGCACEFNP